MESVARFSAAILDVPHANLLTQLIESEVLRNQFVNRRDS